MKGVDFREAQAMPPLYVKMTHSRKKIRKWYRAFGASVAGLESHLRRDGAVTNTFENADGECVHVVWMTDCTDFAAELDTGLLAHEAVHVAQEYFRSIGEEAPSDELQAYVVQHVATYLIGRHFKWKRKRLDER